MYVVPLCWHYFLERFHLTLTATRREFLEARKIDGLTFRLMPEAILIRTLSFGSEEDEWLNVCKDWLEALSPSPGGGEPTAQD